MHFAEFVHMMKTGKLDSLFPGKDWRAGAKQIHQVGLTMLFTSGCVVIHLYLCYH